MDCHRDSPHSEALQSHPTLLALVESIPDGIDNVGTVVLIMCVCVYVCVCMCVCVCVCVYTHA